MANEVVASNSSRLVAVNQSNHPLMLTLSTPEAIVLKSNLNHARWLGRDLQDIVGHNCREWSEPKAWDRSWALFQYALQSRQPLAWERTVVKLNGQTITGHISVQPLLTKSGKLLALCSSRSLEEYPLRDAARESAVYIAEMTAELAVMSGQVGLPSLQAGLGEIAEEAAAALRTLAGKRH